jgi:hypothetical protein
VSGGEAGWSKLKHPRHTEFDDTRIQKCKAVSSCAIQTMRSFISCMEPSACTQNPVKGHRALADCPGAHNEIVGSYLLLGCICAFIDIPILLAHYSRCSCAGRSLKRRGTLAASRKADAARHVAALQHRIQAVSAMEAVRLLRIYSGEHAVRTLFSRPEKLIVPTVLTLADLKGGVVAVASLLSHMSPVQAAGCVSALQHSCQARVPWELCMM